MYLYFYFIVQVLNCVGFRFSNDDIEYVNHRHRLNYLRKKHQNCVSLSSACVLSDTWASYWSDGLLQWLRFWLYKNYDQRFLTLTSMATSIVDDTVPW